MLPSYVTHLPDGHETGTFIGLDLGGTNFRVLLGHVQNQEYIISYYDFIVRNYVLRQNFDSRKMDMQPGNPMLMDSQVYPIPKDCMIQTGEKLFDYLAEKISQFLIRMGLHNKTVQVRV